MARLSMSETQWCKLSKDERARKIVAVKIDGWFAALESWKQSEELKAKNA